MALQRRGAGVRLVRPMPALTNARHELFAQARARGEEQRAAYVGAGFTARTENAIDVGAAKLATRPEMQARILELTELAAERTTITVAKVLERLWATATADPNDLVEHRRGCCRHCHGRDFRRQETPRELEERLAHWERDRLAAAGTAREADFEVFDHLGGAGYDERRVPHPNCPECFGEGVGRTVIKDTRQLTATTRALYAGMKETRDGVQVLMHDQQAALVKVGEQLGMFVKRQMTAEVTLEEILDQLDREGAPGEAEG
jgi:phage terminase small subunit